MQHPVTTFPQIWPFPSHYETQSFQIRNKISSNSSLDDEESYASENLDEILKELAIDEKEKLTTDDDSLDNTQWNKFVNKQQSYPFTGKSGLLLDLPSDISPSKDLSLFLDEKVISLLVTETNRYAEKKLLQCGTTITLD